MSLPAAATQETRPIRPCQEFKGLTNQVNSIIRLPARQRIMTCSGDGSLRVWNLQTGKQITNWRDGEGKVIMRDIALSRDGKVVVSGSNDGAVRLWDINTGKVIAKWTGHTDYVRSVCWNQDAGQVMSGSKDETIRVWDVKSGETVLEIKTGLSVWAAIYSPDAAMIATGGNSTEKQFIKIWEADTCKLVANLKGHTKKVICLAWTANGRTIISGSNDHSIRTWNTTTWQQLAVLTGHTKFVDDIAVSPNGRILASASWDGTARLWSLDNGQPIGSPLQHVGSVRCVSFSADGKLLVTGGSPSACTSWDIPAIFREAGLNELLCSPNDASKSLLDADATRRPVQRSENARRLPQGFFDESSHHPGPSTRRPTSPSFTRHNTLARPRFLDRTRNSFFNWRGRQNDEGIELHGRRSTVVDVPLGQRKLLNVSKGDVCTNDKEKARHTKSRQIAKNASTSGINQQSARVTQVQSSSGPHAAVFTSSTIPGTSTTAMSVTSLPDATIHRVGRWTRFWLFICCTSAEYTNGQH